MRGSTVQNIKFDPDKQKIVICDKCKKEIVVGKYAKNKQRCMNCRTNKKKSVKQPEEKNGSFGAKLVNICKELDFQVTNKRSWKKRYPMDGGGIATIHIMPEQGIVGMEPRVEYFSLVTQRAIGVNENFRKFMPPDAASDCELIANELGSKSISEPQLGQQKCDKCNEYTDQFGVEPKSNRVLCIKPNNCFKSHFTSSGAESVQ
jgi:hypothetical protein